MTIFLAALLLFAQAPQPAEGPDPSITAYWQVTQARLELSAEEWRARIQAAQDAAGDAKKFARDSAAITQRFRGRHTALLAEYGATELQFLRFGSEHAAEVASYLETDEPMRLELAGLRQVIQQLVNQYDAAAAPLLQQDRQP